MYSNGSVSAALKGISYSSQYLSSNQFLILSLKNHSIRPKIKEFLYTLIYIPTGFVGTCNIYISF